MTENIKEDLSNYFKASSIPFLFIGSGFSRRYINLENWPDLLRKMCENISPFDYYNSKANRDLPKVASFIASDLHEKWWNSEVYKMYHNEYNNSVIDIASPLKILISMYIRDISEKRFFSEEYEEELKLLPKLTIDGIITTNWDLFLENFFPDYKVYSSQEELLFSNPQSIGEIYKIHGCCKNPNSLILTEEDYRNFRRKNTYLAAKLITIFVEHPIIFLGYSMQDKNINNLLRAVVNCLGPNDIDKIQNNLIFVQRSNSERKEGVRNQLSSFGKYHIPIKVVTTSSFLPIYEALAETRRKIPVKVLRCCKEQFYELIKENDPKGKLCVIDFNDALDTKKIEFVIGIGISKDIVTNHENSQTPVTNIPELIESSDDIISDEVYSKTLKDQISESKENLKDIISERGYSGLTDYQVFSFFLGIDNEYESKKLLKQTLPEKAARTPYLPIYKFLREQHINNENDYLSSEFKCDRLDKIMNKKLDKCKNQKDLSNNVFFQRKKFKEILIENQSSINRILEIIPMRNNNVNDKDEILDFLRKNISLLENKHSKTLYKKLICSMDRIFYSWN